MTEELEAKGRKCLVFAPENKEVEKLPLLIINGSSGGSEFFKEQKLLPRENCLSVLIMSDNWNDDFTPWAGEALNAKTGPFGGRADEYISFLKDELLPLIKEKYCRQNENIPCGIWGQSLGALFNLYLYTKEPELFSHYACISPSLWYEGWTDYFEKNISSLPPKNWFISCGNREGKKCRDARKETVPKFEKLLELLKENGHKVTSCEDSGDHFNFIYQRCQKAFEYMDKNLK